MLSGGDAQDAGVSEREVGRHLRGGGSEGDRAGGVGFPRWN